MMSVDEEQEMFNQLEEEIKEKCDIHITPDGLAIIGGEASKLGLRCEKPTTHELITDACHCGGSAAAALICYEHAERARRAVGRNTCVLCGCPARVRIRSKR